MSDFFKIDTRPGKRGVTEIYPKFIVGKPNDLMIRGSDFYAIWMEERGLWSTDEQDVIRTIDRELRTYADEYQKTHNNGFHVLYMWDAESGMIDNWHKYCQRQMRDNFHPLDEVLIFSNTPVKKESYASKRLPYPLEPGSINAYDELMGVLYSPEEREKLEWAIGAVVNGASKEVQKFIVLYGDPGSGKSTVLNIVQKLFEGYCGVFDSRALGSSSNAFALEAFKSNPLVSIQHDGDLSRIEDNTRLNSLVSHETMLVNEKFKSQYPTRFNCFLFLGTNKAVKITDAKSGLIRRLIDVTPTGNKLPAKKYLDLVHKVNFELGGIAWHCKEVYEANPRQYDDYIPTRMLGASNDFYNFMLDSFYIFKKEDGVSLKRAWAMYKDYNAETNVQYPYSRRAFREELMNYFSDYKEREADVNGERVRSYYSGFKVDKFPEFADPKPAEEGISEPPASSWVEFKEQHSLLDDICAGCPAQYANENGTPIDKWEDVRTTLSDLDTSRLHYVRIPQEHIVIDFDIPGPDGKKCFEKNLKAASKWPRTYAELSKSGAGIHLHYIYTGDVTKLSRIYDENIEVKVFTGKSSLRRKLSKCNDISVASISSGLPLKGEKMVDAKQVQNERHLRILIKKALAKEINPYTKPNVDFIAHVMEEAYEGNGYFGVKTRDYITSYTLSQLPLAMRQKYEEFMNEGTLQVFDGTVLDMMQVYDDLDAYILQSEYDVRAFGYDPYNAKEFVERWAQENGPFGIEKVIQGARTESVPLGELKKLSEQRKLLFDEALMEFAMGNCITLEDTNGNRKLYKQRHDKKIDAVAALMDAYVAWKLNRDAFE